MVGGAGEPVLKSLLTLGVNLVYDGGKRSPARCHELVADRAGQFAVSVKDPYRLIFEPAGTPVPRTRDGGIDRSKVTKIAIIGVVDYHG